jgi:hypothetical protein
LTYFNETKVLTALKTVKDKTVKALRAWLKVFWNRLNGMPVIIDDFFIGE